jgi:hypothetical protein
MRGIFKLSSIMRIGVAITLWFVLPIMAAAQMSPPTWGNPNRAWGTRRPVTAADQALIASYRSGHKKPLFATDFTNPADLQSQWVLQSDNPWNLKSCRQPRNVIATSTGLELKTLDAVNCHAKWSTGFMISKTKYSYGFFEASIKVADISGMNNAFWLVSESAFEIDIAEVHYPNRLGMTLHNWVTSTDNSVGFASNFNGDFSKAYHDFGALWTPNDIIFEVDGKAIAAISTRGAINKPVDIRFSTALADFAGKVPANPVGHSMFVRSLRVYAL